MECPNNKDHVVMGVEYSYGSPKRYDGVSEIACQTENKRFGRWCHEELHEGESENVFCEGGDHGDKLQN